jgi:hypothetical protein
MMRAVVNVATGHYAVGQERLALHCSRRIIRTLFFFTGKIGCPLDVLTITACRMHSKHSR